MHKFLHNFLISRKKCFIFFLLFIIISLIFSPQISASNFIISMHEIYDKWCKDDICVHKWAEFMGVLKPHDLGLRNWFPLSHFVIPNAPSGDEDHVSKQGLIHHHQLILACPLLTKPLFGWTYQTCVWCFNKIWN